MRIVEPSFEVISAPTYAEVLRVLELSTRTAYKSEDKITDGSAERLLRTILSKKPTPHESVIEHMGITIKFICDRGVSHELVRHRLCAFTQESTRYCDYSKDKHGTEITVIRPCFFEVGSREYAGWFVTCLQTETAYFQLLNWGAKPQEARAVLPNSLKTEIVTTANIRQWRHIFRLRTHKTAHPQMRQLMRPCLAWDRETYPVLFEGIGFMNDSECAE